MGASLILAFLTGASFVPVGYRPPPFPLTHLTNRVTRTSGPRLLKANAETLPAKYDLRDEDGAGTSYLSPIRNQNPYGTCWAHAALAGLEYLTRKSEGIDADFSENNLANMHGFVWGFDDGGNSTIATAVLLREEAPVTEVLDPYAHPGASVRERGVRIPRKIVYVSARSPSSFKNSTRFQADLTAIKQALMQYGPLSTDYYHASSYLKGSAYYCPSRSSSNHAVAIIGWDDNYSASNFGYTPPGDGAFIIRNSWGTGVFEKGYLYISYYDKTLGFNPQIAYARLSSGEDYGRLYQYDPYGYVNAYGYWPTETAHALNIFTARADETLQAFGFYALTANTTYSAKVVLDPVMTEGVLSGSDEIAVGSGTLADPGYEVLDFSTPVSVGTGTNFAIVVTLTTPGLAYPVAVMENYSGYLTNVVAEAGKSFISASLDSAWEDLSAEAIYFCCKVYAKAPAAGQTTCGTTAVPHTWLDAYSASHATESILTNSFYGAYNALSEHVGANGKMIATSYAAGLDPDNASETNLLATISFDADGKPVVDISPKNTALWSYETLGSTNLVDWHLKTAADLFFRIRVTPAH